MAYGMRANRWSDSDRYWWRFTYAKGDYDRPFALVLSADAHEGEDSGINSLRISIGTRTLILALPQIIKPWRHWVDTTKYGWSDNPKGGYWDVHERAYGIGFHQAGTVGGAIHLSVMYGPQTHDSSTEKRWGCFLPWTEWRHVRWSLYDLDGKHFWSEIDSETRGVNRLGDRFRRERYEIRRSWEEMCPKRKFLIRDHDGAEIVVATKIEEREWRKGTGWFTWLSWFKRPIIHRSLDLAFEHEVGPEKGSWKGGLMGTGFAMLPGELHEAALRRYCAEEHRAKGSRYRIEFVGPA